MSYDEILRSVGIKQKSNYFEPLDIGTIVLKPGVTQAKLQKENYFSTAQFSEDLVLRRVRRSVRLLTI